jgi:hypothetical protein
VVFVTVEITPTFTPLVPALHPPLPHCLPPYGKIECKCFLTFHTDVLESFYVKIFHLAVSALFNMKLIPYINESNISCS